MLPDNAPPEYKDRQTLWNAVEKVEKQWNAQLSRGIVMALPRELPDEQYVSLVRGAKLAEYARKHRGLARPLIRTFSTTLSLVGDCTVTDRVPDHPTET